MFKWIRYITLIFIIVAALLWTALQTEPVQEYVKKRLVAYLEDETHLTVAIGALHGIPPFTLGLDQVVIKDQGKKILSIESIDLAPSWFEMIFGKLSFVYASAKGIDLRELPQIAGSKDCAFLPALTAFNIPVSIYALRLEQVRAPNLLYEPLLKNRFEAGGSEVNMHTNISGHLFWKPKDKALSLALTFKPYAGSDSPLKLNTALKITEEITNLDISVETTKIQDGSCFINIPFDHCTLSCNLQAKTANLDSLFNENKGNLQHPLFTGNWQVRGYMRQDEHQSFSPIIRFLASGDLLANSPDNISLASNIVSLQKIEPTRERLNRSTDAHSQNVLMQDLLISDADDMNESTTTSTIISLASPKAIEASLSRDCAVDDGRFFLNITASSLDLGEEKATDCRLAFGVSPQEKGWKGSVGADVTLEKNGHVVPLSLFCDYDTKTNVSLDLQNISLKIAHHELAGKLQLSFYPTVIQGHLASTKEDLTELARQFGFETARGSLLLQFDPQTSDKLKVEVDDLTSSTLFCQKATLSVEGRGLLQNPHIDVTLACKNLQTSSATWDQILCHSMFDPTLERYPFQLAMMGTSKNGPCSIRTVASFAPTSVVVDTFELEASSASLHNRGPIQIDFFSPNSYEIHPCEIHSEKGLCISGQALFTPNVLSAEYTLSEFPVESLDPWFGDLTIFGPISGHLNLTGSARSPKIGVELASSQLAFWDPKLKNAPPLTASLQINAKDGNCQSNLELQGLSVKKPTLLDVRFPLVIHFLPFTCKVSEKGKLAGNIQAEFDLNTLLSPYLDEEEAVDGIVSFAAKVDGSAKHPHLEGDISWQDGKISLPTGCHITNIQMSGKIHDSLLEIEEISANDANSGKITGKGQVSKLIGQELMYDLELEPQNFNIINLDEATIQTTGKTHLSGNLKEALLSGKLELTQAEVRLSTNISKDLPTLDITYVNTDEPKKLLKNPFLFMLDLKCSMPSCHVHGLGLDSEWKGSAHLTGKNSQLDLDGKASLNSGTLTFAGKAFTLTEGSIDFHGDIYKKSLINVVASNEVGSTTTQIVLQGTIDAPRIIFRSNPAMTQKEILSLIIFNKSSSDITPLQGLQLGQILLQMNGKGNNFNLLEQVKQKLHLDRIEIGEGSRVGPQTSPSSGSGNQLPSQIQDGIPNETAVQVGKYISDGVMVTLSKDVTNEVNRVGVEAQLTRHITAEANIGDDSEAELSLEWKLKY